jgi:hypothetical protein
MQERVLLSHVDTLLLACRELYLCWSGEAAKDGRTKLLPHADDAGEGPAAVCLHGWAFKAPTDATGTSRW